MKKNKKEILFLYTDTKFKIFVKAKSKEVFNKATFLKSKSLEKTKENKNIKILSVFVDTVLDKKSLKKFPSLEIIATRSTGIDHIDEKYCKESNIKILNVSEYGSKTVAEFAVASLLYILKKFNINKKDQENRGCDLGTKTIGIFGAGKIGKNFIDFTVSFGCDILVFDPFVSKKEINKKGVKKASFDEILKKSDIISFHTPLCKSTKHMISNNQFKKMKDGVFLVNTARGGLIKTKDLYKNIINGKIKRAAIDVLENEHDFEFKDISKLSKDRREILSLNKKIIKNKKVFYTKHQAYNTKEAVERIWLKTMENVS